MDIKDFFVILGFFDQMKRDTKPDNPRERMDELFDFCSNVSPVEIEGYLYGIGETGLSRLENLKKAIWSSCKFITINHNRIWLCYESDTSFQESPSYQECLETLTALSLSQEEHISVEDLLGADPDLTIVHEEDGADTTYIPDDDPDHEVLIASRPEDFFSPAYREAFTEYIVHEFLEGEKRVFLEKLGSITGAAESSIEIIDRYISREKDRPRSIGSIDELSEKLSPLLSELLFADDVDGERLKRMLLLEETPKLQGSRKGLAVHLLKVLELDGPDSFQESGWFDRAIDKWGLQDALQRLSDESGIRKKRMQSICRIVREVMRKDELIYDKGIPKKNR